MHLPSSRPSSEGTCVTGTASCLGPSPKDTTGGAGQGLDGRDGEAELLAGVKKGLEEVSQLAGEEAEEVWGELLFNLVALANLKGVDAESALRKAVRELEKGLSPAPSRTRTGWHDTGQGAGPTLPRSGVTTKEPSLLLSS